MSTENKLVVEETTNEPLKYDANETEIELLDEVMSKCMKKKNTENNENRETPGNSTSLTSEEQVQLMHIRDLDCISSSKSGNKD